MASRYHSAAPELPQSRFQTCRGSYAAPFISDSNGTSFGDLQASGADQTEYLATGIGEVTLQLDGYNQYFGLLWGSVDAVNTLSFYDGATLLFTFTGHDVDGLANGDQGAAGRCM